MFRHRRPFSLRRRIGTRGEGGMSNPESSLLRPREYREGRTVSQDHPHRTSDIGHRTSDIGHRTSDIGHRAAVLALEGVSALDVFGSPDDMKLRSCATLFAAVSAPGSVFERVLGRYFGGEADGRTLRLLQRD